MHRLAVYQRDLLRPNANTHLKSGGAKFSEVFVNDALGAIIFKFHLWRKSRNKARIAVIARTDKLLAFRVPGDHSLCTSLPQDLNTVIGQLQKRGSKSCFAFVIRNVDLAEVHGPAAGVGRHVNLRARQKDRANWAMIFPIYLERILARVP